MDPWSAAENDAVERPDPTEDLAAPTAPTVSQTSLALFNDTDNVWGSSSTGVEEAKLDFGSSADPLDAIVQATTTVPGRDTSVSTWAMDDGGGAWGGGAFVDKSVRAASNEPLLKPSVNLENELIPWAETDDVWAPPGESFTQKKVDSWSELLAQREREAEQNPYGDDIPIKCLDENPSVPPVGFENAGLQTRQASAGSADTQAESSTVASPATPIAPQPASVSQPAASTSSAKKSSSSSSSAFSIFKRWKKPSSTSDSSSASIAAPQQQPAQPAQPPPSRPPVDIDHADPVDRSLSIIAEQSAPSPKDPQLNLSALEALASNKTKPSPVSSYNPSSKLELLPDSENTFSSMPSLIAPPPAPSPSVLRRPDSPVDLL